MTKPHHRTPHLPEGVAAGLGREGLEVEDATTDTGLPGVRFVYGDNAFSDVLPVKRAALLAPALRTASALTTRLPARGPAGPFH